MTEEMLTPVMNEVGLGFFLEKDNPGQFGHNGDDEGFQALLSMNADTGNGVAIMADSDNGIAVEINCCGELPRSTGGAITSPGRRIQQTGCSYSRS
jgi:hypothetical protein